MKLSRRQFLQGLAAFALCPKWPEPEPESEWHYITDVYNSDDHSVDHYVDGEYVSAETINYFSHLSDDWGGGAGWFSLDDFSDCQCDFQVQYGQCEEGPKEGNVVVPLNHYFTDITRKYVQDDAGYWHLAKTTGP